MAFAAPPLRKNIETEHSSTRTFFSLSQTCRQLRSEYRPLWLIESSVTLDHEDLADYLATFHSLPGTRVLDVKHALKTMTVLWDHEKEDYKSGDLLIDLKPLLNLRASCKWFSVSFESRRLFEADYPHEECEGCNQCISCRGRCKLVDWRAMIVGDSGDEDEQAYYASVDLDEIYPISKNCSHEELVEEVEDKFFTAYIYLDALNDFLNSSNKIWLESIKDDFGHEWMTVECAVGCAEDKIPVIYIRFDNDHAPLVFGKKALRYAACQYLTDVGMIDLDYRPELNFVVGVGTGGTIKHSPGRKTEQVYDQVTFCGLTYEEPAGIVRPARTGDGD